jgi:hypothetical protein
MSIDIPCVQSSRPARRGAREADSHMTPNFFDSRSIPLPWFATCTRSPTTRPTSKRRASSYEWTLRRWRAGTSRSTIIPRGLTFS